MPVGAIGLPLRQAGTMRLTKRGRGAILFGAAWSLLVVAAVAIGSRSNPPTAAEICATPPVVVTRAGVTLTSEAMRAFQRAQTVAHRRITVVQSYRSCAQQRLACINICGSAGGCPGTCAPAGLSWHNRGEAVDLTSGEVHSPTIVSAMEEAGWCQSVPANDPGHFSFNGCH